MMVQQHGMCRLYHFPSLRHSSFTCVSDVVSVLQLDFELCTASML
jgi:hypothetical protein